MKNDMIKFYFKMLFINTVFYSLLGSMVLFDGATNKGFLVIVIFGYAINLIYLLFKIYKELKNE